MHKLLWPATGVALLWLMWPKSAEASTGAVGSRLAALSPNQRAIGAYVRDAALAAKVPPELALAFCELESNFADVQNGSSYGPLQLHKSALRPGETAAQLADMSWNVPRALELLKDRLRRANGNPELARIMYFCGPGWTTSCSEASLARVRARWRPAAARWGVAPAYYSVS